MTIIQAYRRDKPYTHKFPDVTLEFKPNAIGDIVCDVAQRSAVERLLQTPTGFRVYAGQDDEPEAPQEAPAQAIGNAGDREKYVLVNGSDKFDLNILDDAGLRAFAEANGVKVHHAAKGDTIRDKIVEAVRYAEAAEAAKKAATEAGKPAQE